MRRVGRRRVPGRDGLLEAAKVRLDGAREPAVLVVLAGGAVVSLEL